jgi:hypothetical protein
MTKEEVIEILERFVIGAKPCSQREIVDACASAYTMLKEQPSLPSNLDEVAEQYALDVKAKPFGNLVKEAFKAGIEWMAGQGETHELTVESPVIGPPMICCPVHADNGDKVVVQIRKKS